RYAAIGRRHRRRHRLAAAQQRRGPAARHSGDGERQPLRRQLVVLQAQADGGGRAGTHRDRGIVGQQIEPLHLTGRFFGTNGGGQQGESEGKSSEKWSSHGEVSRR